jgi:hypothetical protein
MRQAIGIAATALGVVVALTAGPPTWAQNCYTMCADYYEGKCIKYEQTCTTSPSAPAPSYGAIAYGRTSRAWGYSNKWSSQAKAESVAVQNCAPRGNDCEVMVWFEHKCGAVASGQGTAAFWGVGNSDSQARAEAQSKCVSGGGGVCKVEVSQCSY